MYFSRIIFLIAVVQCLIANDLLFAELPFVNQTAYAELETAVRSLLQGQMLSANNVIAVTAYVCCCFLPIAVLKSVIQFRGLFLVQSDSRFN